MKKRFLLFAVYFGVLTVCSAQVQTVEAIIDFEKEREGHVTIFGKAHSLSDQSQAYSYTMHLTKAAQGNKTNSKQSGNFATQNLKEKIELSSVQINLSAVTQFEVHLKIFQADKMVAERILKSDPIFFDTYKKLGITASQKPTNGSNPVPNEDQLNKKVQKKQSSDIEIGGLILDDTRSKIGRDFYDVFYGKWTDPADGSDFSITIKELPARGRASRVAIEVDGNVIIQRMVQPRQDVIELLAEQSVAIVKNYLSKKKQLNKELESEDQSGSGIF